MNKKTFGSHLRAIRLGFGEVEDIGYVRIGTGGPPWVVDFCPFGVLPKTTSKSEHVEWWCGDVADLYERFRILFSTAPKNKQTTVLLDDDGLPFVEKGETDG